MTLLITAIIISLLLIFMGGPELLIGTGIFCGACVGIVVVWSLLA